VVMPFGQLSPRKSDSRACYLTPFPKNVQANNRRARRNVSTLALAAPRMGTYVPTGPGNCPLLEAKRQIINDLLLACVRGNVSICQKPE
jgi:hypothetical protein